jgi:hypothetical protein
MHVQHAERNVLMKKTNSSAGGNEAAERISAELKKYSRRTRRKY